MLETGIVSPSVWFSTPSSRLRLLTIHAMCVQLESSRSKLPNRPAAARVCEAIPLRVGSLRPKSRSCSRAAMSATSWRGCGRSSPYDTLRAHERQYLNRC